MLRRSLLDLSSRRLFHIKRLPRQINAQNPSFYVCSVREISTTPQQNVSGKPSESGEGVSKAVLGSVAVGTAVVVAYSTGYLDPYLGKQPRVATAPPVVDSDGKNLQELMKESDTPDDPRSAVEKPFSSGLDYAEKSYDSLTQNLSFEDGSKTESRNRSRAEATHEESIVSAQGEEEVPVSSNCSLTAEPVNVKVDSLEEERTGTETLEEKTKEEQVKGTENIPISDDSRTAAQEHLSLEDRLKDVQSHIQDRQQSLLDEYNLSNGAARKIVAAGKSADIQEVGNSSLGKESPNDTPKDLDDVYVSKDGKLVLDFLQAIHAAEQRQAQLDERIHSEEKMLMKEKYEKELRDARARELMYAEDVAMLEKEIKKQTAKAAAALKSLQERAEERLKMELEQKEKAAESKLNEIKELTKAEIAAAIAREKAAQLEEIAETNVNIDALCMAFFARSEEARQNHSLHKLALGALALEDAMSKGRPIQPEIDVIRTYKNDDSLIDLVLSSLPEEIQVVGTDTPLQLNQKFEEMKGELRHFSLLPPGGGGMLAHSLAYIASFLKVKEADKSGNGIESVINRVQSLLAEGKLAEAADSLESGVQGSNALGVVDDWVRRARNRAITEQALMLLHSYTTCMSLT